MKYDLIPPEFYAFCEEHKFLDSSGQGYTLRCAVAELFNVRPDLIRVWLSDKSSRAPCPTIAKIKALLYAVGRRELPTKILEVFEVMVGFKMPAYENVNETLGYSKNGNVVLLDILRGSPMRAPQQKALNEFVSSKRAELEERKAGWLKTLFDAGLDPASLPKKVSAVDASPQVHIFPKMPPADASPPAENPEKEVLPMEAVVTSCAALLNGLLPLLRHLDKHGQPDDFRRLRQATAQNSGVPEAKSLLAKMSSDEARRILSSPRNTKPGGEP